MSPQVSLIGLGGMGIALASAFLNEGYKTTVWNRSLAKAEPLTKKGAHLASTPTECIQASQLVIVCLLDSKAVNDILPKDSSVFLDRTIVNLTNGTPEEARSTFEIVTALGAKYVHGGIMAVPAIIGQPVAIILYSGSKDGFQLAEKHLAVLGTSKFLGVEPGSASLFDLALLGGMYGLFSGAMHSVALARSGTGDTTKTSATEFITELFIPFISGIVAYLGHVAKQIDERDYATEGSNLAMQLIAIENIVKTSEVQGVSTEMIKPIQDLLQQRVADGAGGDDISSIIELMTARKG
ncbi:hypothetical protein FQN54_004569 [Arachnomyces sp. PD_36]|nr:hypothetical protein FQN54_004569 [Arachnomyces sp. PD_36]